MDASRRASPHVDSSCVSSRVLATARSTFSRTMRDQTRRAKGRRLARRRRHRSDHPVRYILHCLADSRTSRRSLARSRRVTSWKTAGFRAHIVRTRTRVSRLRWQPSFQHAWQYRRRPMRRSPVFRLRNRRAAAPRRPSAKRLFAASHPDDSALRSCGRQGGLTNMITQRSPRIELLCTYYYVQK